MSEINEDTKIVDPELLSIPEIKEAIELTEQAAYTLVERAAYDTYWDTVSTEKTLLAYKYQEGIEQGVERGKLAGLEEGVKLGVQQGKIEGIKTVAKALVSDGASIEKIAQLTGLTETEIKVLITNKGKVTG